MNQINEIVTVLLWCDQPLVFILCILCIQCAAYGRLAVYRVQTVFLTWSPSYRNEMPSMFGHTRLTAIM